MHTCIERYYNVTPCYPGQYSVFEPRPQWRVEDLVSAQLQYLRSISQNWLFGTVWKYVTRSINLDLSLNILFTPNVRMYPLFCMHSSAHSTVQQSVQIIDPLNAELSPICYLLALLAHHFLHVSRIRVKSLTLRLLMAYIYIYIYVWQ